MTVLVIDNYDSFVWNLARMVVEAGRSVDVVRNDALSVAAVAEMKPTLVLLSPGPERPESAGICLELIRTLGGTQPMLGVCLGNQAIAQACGGQVVQVPAVHGKPWDIHHDGRGLFASLPTPFTATRYHSLAVERSTLSADFRVTAWTADGTIMAMTHRTAPLVGLQFHPESIASEHGATLLSRVLTAADSFRATGRWALEEPS